MTKLLITINILAIFVSCNGMFAADPILHRTTQDVLNITIDKQPVSVRKIVPIPDDYDQCYVLVTVHNSSSFKYGLENALVTIISRTELSRNSTHVVHNYTGFSTAKTNTNGQACVLAHCRSEALIFAEKNEIRIFALNETMQISRLPMFYNFELRNNNKFIFFFSYPWGTLGGRNGPAFYSDEKDKCLNAGPDDYHFVFSYISVPDVLNNTVSPLTSDDLSDSHVWYYGLKGDRKTCYMKIKIKTFSSQLSIETTSFMNSFSGQRLGTFYTGPQYDVSKSETSERAACILFRCPAVNYINWENMFTYLSGTISAGPKQGCCLRSSNTALFNITPFGFSSSKALIPGQNYGPNEGIFMSHESRAARTTCFTGHDSKGDEYPMDVNTGYAFEYDCMPDADCSLPVIGK